MWVYLNDRFVPKEEAVVSVFDHGFLYGDGVFETLRAYRGRSCQLTEHLARLERSASELGMALPVTRERLADLVRESLTRNQLQEAYLRITVSRGPGEIGLDPALCKSPTLVVIAKPFEPARASVYTDGASLIFPQTRRTPPKGLPARPHSPDLLHRPRANVAAPGARSAGALDTRGAPRSTTVNL